jgi:hypothetical protein
MTVMTRITIPEHNLVLRLREPEFRQSLLDMLDITLDQLKDTTHVMVKDPNLDELEAFNEVIGDHLSNKARIEILRELIEHVGT